MAFSARLESPAITQINVTPLIDVLLVLLIIFMLTSPVLMHKTKIDLPGARGTSQPAPDPIRLAIHADGSLSWNDTPVDAAQLHTQLLIAAQMTEQPALHIDAADGAAYESVARVLTDAKANGLSKIDFVGSL